MDIALTQNDIDALCLDIYKETASASPIAELCRGAPQSYGFEILMGPPFKNAEIAFIGYQPGDWELSLEQAREKGFESGWVTTECHYHVQQWRLARIMRAMFGAALQRCVGLNAVFVRSNNVSSYEAAVPASTRSAIAEYSLAKVQAILAAVQPKRIVIIGFATMDLFGPSEVVLADGDRRLVKTGTVFGRPALITPHLTGARGYTNEHRRKMAEFILK
jgi:hypothetical protein